MNKKTFPLGIAKGQAFLGREQEIKRLTNNLKSGQHTLLLSPRRYGKTSLSTETICKIGWPCASVDLFLAVDTRDTIVKIIQGIEGLIEQLSEQPTQWLKPLMDFFNKANKVWQISFSGVKLELKPNDQYNMADNLLDGLKALEHILSVKKQKAILFIDEFQEICKVPDGKGIEGAIRHFAQSSQYLVFIFSGSNRHLLSNLFGNRSRPLYALCDWMALERLPSKLYKTYLNKLAKKTWGQKLSDDTFSHIILLAECHPEATYALCGKIWQSHENQKTPPTTKDIEQCWSQHLKERLRQTRLNLEPLSKGQLRVLILIAENYNQPISGKEAQKRLDLTSSSISTALKELEKEDLIEGAEPHRYRVIDPVIKSTLVAFY